MAMAAYNASYYAANKEKELERGRRWKRAHREQCRSAERRYYETHSLKKWKGIIALNGTPFDRSDYNRAFQIQMGRCLICRQEPKVNRRLAVDHDHQTMKFRGLLCFPCNSRIGVYELFKLKAEIYLSGGQ